MEALKLIPQVFFDLLARVVPGCVGVVSYLVLFKSNWQCIVTYLFGSAFGKESALLSFFIFTAAGFVVGELLSPLAKAVQRLNEINSYKKLLKRFSTFSKILVDKEFRKRIKYLKRKNKIKNQKSVFSEKKLRYDRLRLKKPEVGALCAKIRAEFTMHNSLSVVFAINSICYPFSCLKFHFYTLAFLLLLTYLTARRGKTTSETFNDTVAKFTQLLNEESKTDTPK